MILRAARDLFERIAQWSDRHSPQTLFARALIIIVVPMLPFAADYQASLGRMAMRLAVMVYTVELLLSRSEFRPSWLLAASGLVLATAGIRVFA